ncbi:hypothetical protein FRC03_005373 [Tulasnella sp. 419]|nr:hypothetical protein FRC03_005373 [Tulasnella sp. 419]
MDTFALGIPYFSIAPSPRPTSKFLSCTDHVQQQVTYYVLKTVGSAIVFRHTFGHAHIYSILPTTSVTQITTNLSISTITQSIPPASRSSSIETSPQAAAAPLVKKALQMPLDGKWEEAMDSAPIDVTSI